MPEMNVQEIEKELEVVSKAVAEYERPLPPPVFELYAAMVSMSVATVMFLTPGILSQSGDIYMFMRMVTTQGGWALMFFIPGIFSALGMLLGKSSFRILSLYCLAILFGSMTIIYVMSFPNFGSVLMFWFTVFTVTSIPLVKRTGLRK